MRFWLFIIPILFYGDSTYAQQKTIYYKLSTGTGFVINREGHVVTNAHVVKSCQSISILTPQGEEEATLVAEDEDQDLAVLKTGYISPSIAFMRQNVNELSVGDEVSVIGYPGKRNNTGQYLTRKTRVVSLESADDTRQTIQIRSSATFGNSGGPVIDSSGNVIGVITGKLELLQGDEYGNAIGPVLKQTNYAIALTALENFLRANGISFYEALSNNDSRRYTRNPSNVRDFIIPVRCVLDTQVSYN